jgi:hypothetical protein
MPLRKIQVAHGRFLLLGLYILPPLCAAAIYGFIEAVPFYISTISFFLPCLRNNLFLNETSKSGKHLKSALTKYEVMVEAVENLHISLCSMFVVFHWTAKARP